MDDDHAYIQEEISSDIFQRKIGKSL